MSEQDTKIEQKDNIDYSKIIEQKEQEAIELKAQLDAFNKAENERKESEKKAKEELLKKQNEWEKLASEREAELKAKNLELSKLAEQNKTFQELNEKRRLKLLDKYIEINKVSDADKVIFESMTEEQLDHLVKSSTKTPTTKVVDGTVEQPKETLNVRYGIGDEAAHEFIDNMNKIYNS